MLLALNQAWPAATLPANFYQATVGSGWNEAVGLCWDTSNRMFVWERAGRVWMVENGVKQGTPLIDISEEVGGWRDYGLLGFALDPSFASNGRVYLFYVVDRHYLTKFGTPAYSATTDEYFAATIGRITRYTLVSSNNQLTCDYGSRFVLLGESITNGVPILYESHGVGSLAFGEDGTLLASAGEGASYDSTDVGSNSKTYWQQGLADGIIRTNENVGAYRAQMIDSLSGKVLRLDPATGDGVPGNPWFDPTKPRAAKSRVWALGLRNPCRIGVRPGTGSHNPADANPGIIMIGDVGWRTWEELNICSGPGQNFGWPCFEGMDPTSEYYGASVNVENRDAPNPANTCGRPYFYFRELIVQDTLATPSWPNPCNPGLQIPASTPTFMNRRPRIDWKHVQGNTTVARAPIYNGTAAASALIGQAGSPVAGPSFKGNASIGGAWYAGASYPPQYSGMYFHADYGEQWIKQISVDGNNNPTAIQPFLDNAGGIVFVAANPTQGDLYYINWTADIYRISYNTNLPPTAVIQTDKQYGPGPLTVSFSGAGSFDPENGALSYLWNFGDGTTSTQVAPQHTFTATNSNPTAYLTTLRVTDPAGRTNAAAVAISVNNTPPTVNITSPTNQMRYSLTDTTSYSCVAQVTDAEQSTNALTYKWLTTLYHNNHTHSDPPVTNVTTVALIDPIGCDGETYFYGIALTVTDPLGLSATKEVYLYPDCAQLPPTITWAAPLSIVQGTALSTNQLKATASIAGAFAYLPALGTVLPAGSNQVLTATFTPFDLGQWSMITATQYVTVTATNGAPPPSVTITSPTNGAHYSNGASIPIALNVASNGWSIGSVELRENTSLVNALTNPPYNFLLSNASGGSKSLQARACYNGTNFASSAPVVVGVDWKPVQMTLLSLTNNVIRLAIDADTNRAGQIESSTNLLNWSVVADFTNDTGLINFVEPAATTNRSRFYRSRFAP